jgi:hypothetical protein
MKAKLRTQTLRAEVEGPISSCIVDLLRFVRDRRMRGAILVAMEELHREMSVAEDEKALAAADFAAGRAPPIPG